MGNIIVSAIMSVYNTPEKWLDEAIDSVINQTVQDLELIIVDDASDNGNAEYLDFRAKRDQRLVILHNENKRGLTKNLNYALSIAKGKYIARLDSDDVALPDRFRKQIEYLSFNDNVVMVAGDAVHINEKSEITGNHLSLAYNPIDVRNMLYWLNVIVHSTVMWKSDFFKEHELKYNEEFTTAQDYELWSRVTRVGDIAVMHDVVCKYRISTMQITKIFSKNQCHFAYRTMAENVHTLIPDITEDELSIHKSIVDCNCKYSHHECRKWLRKLLNAANEAELVNFAETISIIYCRYVVNGILIHEKGLKKLKILSEWELMFTKNFYKKIFNR